MSTPNSYPLVSFVIASYNHEKYIRQTIESILNQDYPNIELIIVDDSSSDGSKAIIEEYRPRVKAIIFHEKNLGVSATMGDGFALCEGKYYIAIASDDVCELHRVKELVAYFEKLPESVAFVATDYSCITPDDEVLPRTQVLKKKGIPLMESKDPVRDYLESNLDIAVVTLIYRSESLRQLGGYDYSLSQEDLDILYRLLSQKDYAYLDQPLVQYRVSPNSFSRNKKSTRLQEAHIMLWLKIYAKERPEIREIVEKRTIEDALKIYRDGGNQALAIKGLKQIPTSANFKARLLLYYMKWSLPRKAVHAVFFPQTLIKRLFK